MDAEVSIFVIPCAIFVWPTARTAVSVATPAAASIPLGSSPALVLALARPRLSRASLYHFTLALFVPLARPLLRISFSVARARARPALFHSRDRVAVGNASHRRSLGMVVETGRAAEWERTLPKGVVESGDNTVARRRREKGRRPN